MGYCKKRELIKPKHTSDDCVCDVVRKIVEAQDEVQDDCTTSCNRSIQQLRGKELDPLNTTIPFILYCSGTCEPFVGSGVFQAATDRGNFFGCVETPVFRATQFVNDSDCCVKLELLLPACDGCEVKPCNTDNVGNVCKFFPEDKPVTDFIASGVCLTVDLNHFAGITCLDPINPML
ncbi:CotY/CotZ family spore coat protein [Virgibacillus halodenitrificans]|uniref:CotY/CotZ family spore coat protein n=1 Tax=Virgibacillus halodenitrificans TaxID=1482 RepID=UPI001F36A005|nr:CotY/CotZ family spore coat protein [Virgibacillus halodenitrificans]